MTQSPQRILFVSTQMEAGGVQMRATSMMQALQKEGHESRTLFLYTKRPIYNHLSGVSSLLDHPPRGVSDIFAILVGLVRYLREFRPTAVVGMAHYASPLATFSALLLGISRRIATQTNPPKSRGKLARTLDQICGTTGIYTANIAASDTIFNDFDHYPEVYRKRLHVVSNGITVREPKLTKQAARAKFGLSSDAFLMVNCGRLSKQKNQTFLLEILEEVPDLELLIVGEGEEREALTQAIQEKGLSRRVHLLGEVHPNEVPNALICGDIFVFPSKYEAFGLAAVEAMNAGLPVLASDHPALAEVVADAGRLISLDDSTRWAEAIVSLRTNAGEQEKMSLAGKLRAKKYSFDAMLTGFKKYMF